ncbi:MAG: group II intron reverse transcriptase/maturase [Flavobacteriales bacterium]|nr:group II intron reverse transcriptase/maturase [Flavobacteriales bacterium]
MDQIVSRKNMTKAYNRVVGNNGSSGIDGMSVDDLKCYLQGHWTEIKGALLRGDYYPQLVRQVEIPKPNGGVRLLGIPTVMDRLLQQAIHQVLEPIFDPTFSDNSYGFRPNCSARKAVKQAKEYVRSGGRWIVNVDLSKFFDEVDHDRLLSKLRIKIADRRVIHLIERYLRVGVMNNGIEQRREKGTPQGSPLSPLLSNIVLDELDKELEKRKHQFVRYADDFQIYVGSKKAAERVMRSLEDFIENTLKLKVNKKKSTIERPWHTNFLGYSFTSQYETKLKVSKESISRFKMKVKELFRKGKGRNVGRFIQETLNPVIGGWMIYFSASDVKGFTQGLDQWIRRRLRKVIWQQMKRNWTRFKALIRRGLSEQRAAQSAFNKRGPWWNSGSSHMNEAYSKRYFELIGLLSLKQAHSKYYSI